MPYKSPFSSPEGPDPINEPDLPEHSSRFSRIRNRLTEAASDPELGRKAAEVAIPYGAAALRGAGIESGLLKERKGKIKVRKLGVARALVQPVRTARKAVRGAVSETRSAVRDDVVANGRRRLRDGFSNHSTAPELSDDDTPPPSSIRFSDDDTPPPSRLRHPEDHISPLSDDDIPPPSRIRFSDYDIPPPPEPRHTGHDI